MKKQLLYIICAFVLICYPNTSLFSQVVIGKNVEPKPYSLLQIETGDNTGGVLLPRVSESERAVLQNKISTDTDATGLTIFNTTTLRVEYWNGREWVAIPGIVQPTFTADNGLHDISDQSAKTQTVKLGGSLSRPTNIILNEQILTIDQEPNTRFEIGLLSAGGGNVGIGTSPDTTARLHINKDPLQTHGLKLVDGSQKRNRVLTALDNTGKAKWQELPQTIEVDEGTIASVGTGIGYTEGADDNISYKKISTESVKCGPGKWLIIGRFMSEGSTAGSNYYSWAKLQTTGGAVLSVGGVKAEPGGLKYSIPQVVYYGEFTTTTYVDLYAAGPGSSSKLSNYGGVGFIRAIKLANL